MRKQKVADRSAGRNVTRKHRSAEPWVTSGTSAQCLRRREFFALATSAYLTSLSAGNEGSRSEVSWLADVQQPPGNTEDLPKLTSILPPDATLADWLQQRKKLRESWLGFLGTINRPQNRPTIELLDEERAGTVVRQLIRYENQPNWPTEAYVLKPAATDSVPRPGVVVFHSTVAHSIRQPAGVEGTPEKAFGLELAKRGFVTLCPRNFLWPDNQTIDAKGQTQLFASQHGECKGMAKMLLDAQVAVDMLSAMPSVDTKRIGALGHSLGAKEVLYLTAFDERIKVAVSSEGGIGTRFSNWDAPWYLGAAIKQPQFSREHHELLALAAPRPFLLVGGDSADGARSWPFIEAALPIYRLYGNVPRLGLFHHKQGHAVPPVAEKRIYEWIETYL
jgi:dienelactone hydrolase